MEFKKNELINQVLEEFYNTYSKTLDTSDFVPEKFNYKIHCYIFKEMKKKFKEINKEYRKIHKEDLRKEKMNSNLFKAFGRLFFRSRKKDLENIDKTNLMEMVEGEEVKEEVEADLGNDS